MLYLIVLPVVAFYFVFRYIPMFGIIIAFKDYKPVLGMLSSPWTSFYGLNHFKSFFTSPFLWRLLRNTVLLSAYNLGFGFPAPILLALMLSQVRSLGYKRGLQTVTYFPHFISQVVVCGIIREFCLSDGLFNVVRTALGFPAVSMLQEEGMFRSIYVATNIWQEAGWSSIIYLAAIAGIDPILYEAAALDGASRLQCIRHVTLPGIKETVVIMFIMAVGKLMDVGSEKILLLYNETIYKTADVISTYVYRRGLLESNWSFSTAVGLFNSAINFTLVLFANWFSRRVTGSSLF